MNLSFADALQQWPLIAVLRDLPPERTEAVADLLLNSGWRVLLVTLPSPDALLCMQKLAYYAGNRALIGADQVITANDVDAVYQAGGRTISITHVENYLLTAARLRAMSCLPGVATPSEGFAALRADAAGLQLFPPPLPTALKHWRSVFTDTLLLPRAVLPTDMQTYWQAGASGFIVTIKADQSWPAIIAEVQALNAVLAPMP